MSVIFDDGKLVFQQKKKVLEMTDLMGSKSVIRRSDYDINEFRKFVENYMYIPDDEFEFMNSSIEEPRERFDDEKQYSDLFRRKSNIQIQEQNNRTYINYNRNITKAKTIFVMCRQIESLLPMFIFEKYKCKNKETL